MAAGRREEGQKESAYSIFGERGGANGAGGLLSGAGKVRKGEGEDLSGGRPAYTDDSVKGGGAYGAEKLFRLKKTRRIKKNLSGEGKEKRQSGTYSCSGGEWGG